jgi:AcrR family transcriptional regulator
MGISERKQREKEEMRRLILQTAMRLFTERGFESVSIRNIAEEIEYSPATIYLYFKDKNELLHHLHEEGFRILHIQMQRIAQLGDPLEKLMALSKVYIDFGLNHPEMYDLMFILNAPMNYLEEDEAWTEGEGTFKFLVDVIIACQQEGRFAGKNPLQLALMCWSFVHGLVSLEIRHRTRVCSRMQLPQGDYMEMCRIYFNETLTKL